MHVSRNTGRRSVAVIVGNMNAYLLVFALIVLF